MAIGDASIARASLEQTLDLATQRNKEERIFLRADKSVPYGELVEVMNILRGTSYLKIALVGLSADPVR